MHFLTSVWLSQVIGIMFIAISETTVVHLPSTNITAFYGDTVNFKWTSNVSISEATWGIRSGSNANPQYIFVDDTGSPPVISGDKSRLHFTGNLAAGQAWFALSNVTASDSNTYIGLIREQGSAEGTLPYYVQLTVGPKPTSGPSTSLSSTCSTMVPSTPTTTTTRSPTTSTTRIDLPTSPSPDD